MTYRSNFRFFIEGIEGLGLLPFVLCLWPVTRHWLRQWGSRPEERDRTWPGDELVSLDHEAYAYTRAIDIDAPGDVVWQWVVQFGLGRAGFYSYELLERVVGIPVKNVESIVPAFQSLAIGDKIRLHPKAPGIPIALLEPERYVCFGEVQGSNHSGDEPDPLRSWSFYVEPVTSNSCRLILRGCIEGLRKPTWLKRMFLALEEPIDFFMEQRMLRTIRRLAESLRKKREGLYEAA